MGEREGPRAASNCSILNAAALFHDVATSFLLTVVLN